jgi:hypothetical protein
MHSLPATDPVLERSNTLRKAYVPNDLDLSMPATLQILNGPNNSGTECQPCSSPVVTLIQINIVTASQLGTESGR